MYTLVRNKKGTDTFTKRTMVGCLLFFLLACFLSSCIANAEHMSAAKLDKDNIVGGWTPGGSLPSYNFYSDGGFRLMYESAWGGLDRRLYRDGTWTLTDSTLTIAITSLTNRAGGKLVYSDQFGYHYYEGAEELTDIVDPPYVREFSMEVLQPHYRFDDTEGKKERPYLAMYMDGELIINFFYPMPRNEEEEEAIPDW